MPTVIRTGILHVPALDPKTGAALRQMLRGLPGAVILHEDVAPSERNWIEDALCRWCDEAELDLVLTVGGTLPAPGPGKAEIVPAATRGVLERELPGLSESMRAAARMVTPLALLERGVAGIRGRTLLLNLPAASGPATFFLGVVMDVIPALVAHLREEPDAPTLAGAGDWSIAPRPESPARREPTPRSAGKGLNAEDFAAFLARRKQQGE